MKTVRIIVSGEECKRIKVSKEKPRKELLSFLPGKKKEPVAMCGKDGSTE